MLIDTKYFVAKARQHNTAAIICSFNLRETKAGDGWKAFWAEEVAEHRRLRDICVSKARCFRA